MQKTIQLITPTGANYILDEINALQADGWTVAQTATPVGCTAVIVIMEKPDPPAQKPE